MDSDISQALASLRGMATGFVAFLPYLALALVVYALFHAAGRHADGVNVDLAERRRRHRILGAVKSALQHVGVDMPHPTTQVLFRDRMERTDRDRSRQREGWPAGGGELPSACDLVGVPRARHRAPAGDGA